MIPILRRICRDSAGATAIEYGLIAALIVIAIMGAIAGVADESIMMWERVSDEVQASTP